MKDKMKNNLIIGMIIALVLVVGGIIFIFNNESDLDSEEINQEERNYVSRNIEECSRTQILCVEGLEFFSDETDCGCEEKESTIKSLEPIVFIRWARRESNPLLRLWRPT